MKTETYIKDGIIFTKMTQEDSDLATLEQNQSRLEICQGCEHFNQDRCGSCGCLLEQLMMYKTSKCPLNKW